jgi:hypothetical protein
MSSDSRLRKLVKTGTTSDGGSVDHSVTSDVAAVSQGLLALFCCSDYPISLGLRPRGHLCLRRRRVHHRSRRRRRECPFPSCLSCHHPLIICPCRTSTSPMPPGTSMRPQPRSPSSTLVLHTLRLNCSLLIPVSLPQDGNVVSDCRRWCDLDQSSFERRGPSAVPLLSYMSLADTLQHQSVDTTAATRRDSTLSFGLADFTPTVKTEEHGPTQLVNSVVVNVSLALFSLGIPLTPLVLSLRGTPCPRTPT